MKLFLLVLCFTCALCDLASVRASRLRMVQHINSLKTTWTAGLNQGSSIDGASNEQVKSFLGALKGGPKLPRKTFPANTVVPDTFDSATNWPQCPSMKVIRDQSACGSCWAFGAVEAMTDRNCIHLNKPNLYLSSGDMAFCCDDCGDGCNGGYPSAAWQYWVDTGLVEEGCYPYPFPSCDHHLPNSPNPCPSGEYPTPDCPNACNSSWNGPGWKQDLHLGASAYSLAGENDIKAEIFKNGPVETAFTVYEDFLTYKSGVYKHTSGGELGGHAVKFMGWGVENNVPYWLVANSWNPNWGYKGFFKIYRGQDECGIEDEVSAGLPKN